MANAPLSVNSTSADTASNRAVGDRAGGLNAALAQQPEVFGHDGPPRPGGVHHRGHLVGVGLPGRRQILGQRVGGAGAAAVEDDQPRERRQPAQVQGEPRVLPLEVDVPEGGTTIRWSLELNSPNNLKRQGWSRSAVKTGDKVTVRMNPLRDGQHGGLFLDLKFANGKVLDSGLPKNGQPVNVPRL